MAETQAKAYYTVAVLEKTLRIIELMAREYRWELGHLAEVSGLPKGTLQRILLTLAEHGYVRKDRGRYALTLSFYHLGQRIAANNSILEHARPFCRRLMEAVNETVNLCVPLNTDMVVFDQQVSWQMLRLDSIIGSKFPIFRSASGKVYCAFLDELAYLRLLEEIRRANPGLTQEDVDRFNDEIILSRRDGIGFDYEEIFQGVRCVAAPVFNYTGAVVATVGFSVPTVRLSEEVVARLVSAVSTCAAQISRSVGAPARHFVPCTRSLLVTPRYAVQASQGLTRSTPPRREEEWS